MVIDTVVGDVLILSADALSPMFAVGLVTADGQLSFVPPRHKICTNDRAMASAIAKAMVGPGRRISIGDFSDSGWSEVTI